MTARPQSGGLPGRSPSKLVCQGLGKRIRNPSPLRGLGTIDVHNDWALAYEANDDHQVVIGTVGLLSVVTLIALFVFMAFTIILIPVSLLGLVGGVLVVVYAYVAIGHLVGRAVPTDSPGLSTAFGAVGFLVASRLVGLVPIVGDSISLVVLVIGLGAVLITYFGLRACEPPTLGTVE